MNTFFAASCWSTLRGIPKKIPVVVVMNCTPFIHDLERSIDAANDIGNAADRARVPQCDARKIVADHASKTIPVGR